MTPNKPTEQIKNPNEYLDIPKWINEDYFLPILETNLPHYSSILKFTTIAATAPGENYTSILVRVIIDVELKDGNSQQVSYILKTLLDASNHGAAYVESMNLFPKEKQLYTTYIPKFEKIYKEAGLNVKFGPKCLHFDDNLEKITLVMEDLKRKNFGNIDRLKGLDMAHMQAVLNKLAEFHAASAVCKELEGPYEPIFLESFLNEQTRSLFAELYEPRVKLFDKALMEWGLEEPEKYIATNPTFDEFFDENLFVNTIDPNEFNVLNHGDCWSNNIMFSHGEDGKVQETFFIDFQLCKWGSPAQDLWYLITTSGDLAIKVTEFDHFIQMYHKRLLECLTLLKYKKRIPSLKDLHIMLYKYGYWGVFAAKSVVPVVLFPSDKDASMDTFMKPGPEADAFRFKVFTNPIYSQAMLQFFPFLYNKGLFDIKTNHS